MTLICLDSFKVCSSLCCDDISVTDGLLRAVRCIPALVPSKSMFVQDTCRRSFHKGSISFSKQNGLYHNTSAISFLSFLAQGHSQPGMFSCSGCLHIYFFSGYCSVEDLKITLVITLDLCS